MERVQPIEGFKVMDWLRSVRKEYHKLYMKDPQEYDRRLKMAGKRLRKRINSASENLN